MQISYNWLKELLPLHISPEELNDKLTFAGIEVEAVHHIGQELRPFITVLVEEALPHPDSDHLHVCRVQTGRETLQVVCGAPNCHSGMIGVLAPVGTEFKDFTIKKAKIRGVESFGMLCSEQELGISDKHDGIIELPADTTIGLSYAEYLQANDTVFEVEITPNRPDLLGMLGVARDLSALLQIPLLYETPDLTISGDAIHSELSLTNEEPERCPRYTGRMIKNVTIKDSPLWLQKRLLAVGLRPINNVVDVTNYVMMEYGHPLHAFDYNLLAGKGIVVRKAKEGESFSALDGKTYFLTSDDLVIADKEKASALAGVIGGTNTCISTKTTDIVLEVACFDYAGIRRTSWRHKIFTDSSYRFERGMSILTMAEISQRATTIILELAGGELVDGWLDSNPMLPAPIVVPLRPSRIKQILTVDLDNSTIIAYLQALGLHFVGEKEQALLFAIPSTRNDLTREIDLIEEIIRLHGYNNVETKIQTRPIMDWDAFRARRKVQDVLVQNGLFEACNISFADPRNLDLLLLSSDDERRKLIEIVNPMGSSMSTMRSTLIPGLLRNLVFNWNRGEKQIQLFELNKVFLSAEDAYSKEVYHVTGIMTGDRFPIYWKEHSQAVTIYDVKGIVEELLATLQVASYHFGECSEPYYMPGVALDIYVHEQLVGSFGKVNPRVLASFELDLLEFKQDVYLFDIDIDAVLRHRNKAAVEYEELPRFPYVRRDLSFIVSKEYSVSSIISVIQKANRKAISKVELFDEFIGKQIREGYRSLSFSIILRSNDKTLTDEIVDGIIQKVMHELTSHFQIEMR